MLFNLNDSREQALSYVAYCDVPRMLMLAAVAAKYVEPFQPAKRKTKARV